MEITEKKPENIKLLEPASPAATAVIQGVLSPDEEVLIQVCTDLEPEGRYGESWVVVTTQRLLVVPVQGVNGITEVSLDSLRSVRTEPLVGGGRLEVERQNAPTLLVPYSSTLSAKFSEVARGLEQLRQNQSLLVNPNLDRTRCAKCARLLPEKNGLCPACISRLATLKRIAAYLKPYKGRVVILALSSIIGTLAELAPPLLTKRIVDEVFTPGVGNGDLAPYISLLGLLVMGLIGVRVASWIGEWMHVWTATWLGARVTADIRSLLYRRLEMLSLQFYDKRQVGALMSRVTQDSGMLQDFLVEGMPYLILNGLMLLGILGFLLYMSWDLTLYILMPVPLLLAWGMLFWKRMRRFFHKTRQSWSHLTARLQEVLSGIRVVKTFAQEPREIAEFDKRNSALVRVSVQSERNWFVFFATMNLVSGTGVAIVWYFGGHQVLDGSLSMGTLLAFYSYMWLLYGPMQWFGQVNSWMTRAFAGAERIFEILDTPPEAYEDPDAVAMPVIEGRVTLRKVRFGYDKSKPVLNDLDLEVVPGEMIGLVGKSGVGKTTTVSLLARFYDADQGVIEIDGVDIRKIKLGDLRRQIGIVPQEPFLFSGTIAANIGYGRPGASMADIMAAARAANAHNFIMGKPDGYDTPVGEKGSRLSGGERQRVAIARAVLHNPRILILDEATSSVDVQTEKQIQEALAHLVKGRTTFAIAHRLSTLRNANRLVVMEGGRIIETGTHEELMTNEGHFYELVKLQQQVAEVIAIKE
ncbi:MAG: ATP-binding cassette domain-containing protein [Candidatus Latescibacteria bacterium]|nr:ATP-binding cassette domain-containing protein [Candidatus Latescibacterota bacterium]